MERRRKFNLRRSTRSYYSGGGGGDGSDLRRERDEAAFNLKWNMQGQHVLSELGRLFKLEETRGGGGDGGGLEGIADVTLFSSEGDCIQAHKLVLMLCSPYFKKMFNQVSKGQRKDPRDNAIVVLSNVKSGMLRHLVRFMYTGEVNLRSGRELEEFQKIARYFGIVGLSKTTRSSSVKRVSKEDSGLGHRREKEELILGGGDETVEETGEEELRGDIQCKLEPPEDVILDLDSADSMADMDFGGGGDLEDDGGSNFSDNLEQNVGYSSEEEEDNCKKDPSVSFAKVDNEVKPHKSKKDEEDGELKLNWRTGKLNNWIRIDPLSEEEMKKDWRKKNTCEVASNISHIYYCPYGGKKCPAALKIKILRDGTSIYFRNAYDHANHRDPDHSFGLTAEQKRFVNECLDNGITQPNNMLLKFELSGLKKPLKSKLNNMLQRYRKKFPEKFGKKPEPKWPRRIRKKKPSDGPPKKRGRPSTAEKEAAAKSGGNQPGSSSWTLQHHPPHHPPHTSDPPSSQNTSTSSSPVPPATAGSSGIPFQPHPNHFLGQAPFPFSQLPPHYPFENLR